MVRVVPEEPDFATSSEREVWTRLRDQLGDEDVLLANLRLTDSDRDHEADLVVAMPGYGILVLEVKGAGTLHAEDGWWMRYDGEERPVDPVAQARGAKYAIRRYVEHHPRWDRPGRWRGPTGW